MPSLPPRTAAREKDLWTRLVNSKFEGQQPILSGEESVAAARRLYRHAMKKPFAGEVKLTSGNRYTWVRPLTVTRKGNRVRTSVLAVNPDKRELHARGLRALIHDLSHYCHQRLHPQDDPHSARQAYLERDLVDYAIKSGFLDGKLARAKPAQERDVVKERYARIVARRDKWRVELEKAKKLLAKAEREAREYERRHRDRLK